MVTKNRQFEVGAAYLDRAVLQGGRLRKSSLHSRVKQNTTKYSTLLIMVGEHISALQDTLRLTSSLSGGILMCNIKGEVG